MKRYKQAILSNYFVTTDDMGTRHLVEANFDIESRGDRTLCTEVLQGKRQYQVLTNHHLHYTCMIRAAILDRRISNMPKERKSPGLKSEFDLDIPESQLCLLTASMDFGETEEEPSDSEASKEPVPQFDLFG